MFQIRIGAQEAPKDRRCPKRWNITFTEGSRYVWRRSGQSPQCSLYAGHEGWHRYLCDSPMCRGGFAPPDEPDRYHPGCVPEEEETDR